VWYKLANQGSVPKEPSTTPIPNGMVRRFHVTQASPEIIRNQGLLQSAAKGFEGPKAIYSWDNYEDAKGYSRNHAPIVEFYTEPNKIDGQHQFGDIPPNQIIAIHEPWHDRFRYCLENNVPIERMRSIGDKDYNRAADEIEKINKFANSQEWWRRGYYNRGHSWNSSDTNPDDESKANLPPPNPKDAIWIFRNGQLQSVTAQEWHEKGQRGYTFIHDNVFGEEYGGVSNFLKGRFDSSRNVVSMIKNDNLTRGYSVFYRALERKFPGAKIEEFAIR